MIGRFGGLASRHVASAGTLLSLATLLSVAVVAGAPQPGGQADLPGASHTGKLGSHAHPAATKAVRPAGQGRPASVHIRRMRLADGAVMTVASISGPVKFVLHSTAASSCRQVPAATSSKAGSSARSRPGWPVW